MKKLNVFFIIFKIINKFNFGNLNIQTLIFINRRNVRHPIFRASPENENAKPSTEFKTVLTKSPALGPNSELCKGSNDEILL